MLLSFNTNMHVNMLATLQPNLVLEDAVLGRGGGYL
jgi:hypothetical protein